MKWIVLALAFLASPLTAQSTSCGPYEAFRITLEEKYDETPVAFGMITDTLILQLFRSESGSWTVLTVSVDGTACLRASGQAWTETKAAKGDEG